jgi:hypothetical protein
MTMKRILVALSCLPLLAALLPMDQMQGAGQAASRIRHAASATATSSSLEDETPVGSPAAEQAVSDTADQSVGQGVAAAASAPVARLRSTPAPTPPPAIGKPPIGLLRLDNDFTSASKPSSYRYVILNAWESDKIAGLKAANPGIKVLVYKDMSSTRSYACSKGVDDSLLPTGVGYCAANQNHADWFLTDTNGVRIQWVGYDGHWQMDVGSAAYQDAWLGAVGAEVKAKGWDGIEVDNAMTTPKYYLSGRTLAKYPTDASYSAATESFLSRVAPPLVSSGLLVLPNISDAGTALWTKWIGYTSGAIREGWTRDGDHYLNQADWTAQAALMTTTQAQGKAFVAITYASTSDVQAMRYALASFLVEFNGGPSALIVAPGTGIDPWSREWTVDMGAPQGLPYRSGGAWRRDYTGGTAIANPSAGPVTVALGGPYTMPDGSSATSTTLNAHSGLVIRRA